MSDDSPIPNEPSASLPANPDSEPNQPAHTDPPFPVVGIAASAGGLEAFTELIRHLPTDTGMAFVLIQHLSPDHESLLPEILGRVTAMPVRQVQDQMQVEPNTVYVIPPNTQMTLVDGRLRLAPRQKSDSKYLPADVFLESLATDRGNKAIAVVLSGMDGDGAQGVKAVKMAGGVTFAQSDSTAQFSSMPHTAVATGNVDFVLPPQTIAAELTNLSCSPFLVQSVPFPIRQEFPPEPGDPLTQIFSLLRTTTGVDFTKYKPTTLNRRIQRRMMLYKLERLEEYVQYLQAYRDEIQALYEEILIHVTSFFRDPQVFEQLKTQVFPTISQNKSSDVPIRIWVAGCSTGEEVYSIAICLLEFFNDRASVPSIQIFATDIRESAISKARSGAYVESQMEGVSPERKNRFFVPQAEGGYHISSAIRELCVFARHNLAGDPPFSNLDLIICRNVLIYLSDPLQERIMALFHYSLNLNGFLLLGNSESVKTAANLFATVDDAIKLYTRRLTLSRPVFAFTTSSPSIPSLHRPQRIPQNFSLSVDLAREVDQLIANRYAPISVVVDEQMQILQMRGDLDPYLKLAPSTTELNLLTMARDGLEIPLRTALYQAQTQNVPVRQEQIQLESSERLAPSTTPPEPLRLNLEVLPFQPTQTNACYFLVFFNPIAPSATEPSPAVVESLEPVDLAREIVHLRQALAAATQRELSAQAHLQAVIQEQTQLNQNLRVANEEILSSNEELQSTNEELQTAKEEIQATNEELATTNDELRSRNLQQNRDNSDLNNFIASISIPIVMLTNELTIRRFTPTAQRLFNFIPTDVGRPFSDLHGNFDVAQLEPMILEVLDTLNTKEQEIQTRSGYWYSLRIRPYRTTENQIDGVTLVFLDIDALKRHVAMLDAAREQAEAANRTDEFLSNLSHELRNPLTSLLSWVQLLRDRTLDEAGVERALETIERSARSQNQLIEDILDVSRITTGKLRLNRQPIDLALVVQAALDRVHLAAVAKNIQIVPQLSSITVQGDADRLQQVLGNVLSNAIKFTPAGGRVDVTLSPVNNQAQIQVSDTGKGIPADLLPQIFKRFYQGDASTTKANQGLGLGLAIVRHLIDLHGGTVSAESPGEGQGTTMTIRLPLYALPPPSPSMVEPMTGATEEPSLDASPQHPALEGLQILVVEDQVDVLLALQLVLEGYGAEVMTVTTAKAAIAALSESPGRYNMLISDIGLPEENGYYLIQQVRSLSAEAGRQIPAIALTGYEVDPKG
jgi:two-component system, chemotaxis family, CheB/CheR fusion protein